MTGWDRNVFFRKIRREFDRLFCFPALRGKGTQSRSWSFQKSSQVSRGGPARSSQFGRAVVVGVETGFKTDLNAIPPLHRNTIDVTRRDRNRFLPKNSEEVCSSVRLGRVEYKGNPKSIVVVSKKLLLYSVGPACSSQQKRVLPVSAATSVHKSFK